MNHIRHTIILSLALPLLSACAAGPDYVRPPVEVPASFKEQAGDWKLATPKDDENRGAWWSVYKDAELDKLVQAIDVSNQTLKMAEASYKAALATVSESESTLFPTLSLTGAETRAHSSKTTPQYKTDYSLGTQASWSLDVWGRVRRTIESDEANAQASAADLAAVKLSLQSTLATTYFNLRAQDKLKELLNSQVENLKQSYQIMHNQFEVGMVAKADLLSAESQLQSTQAQAINADVRRSQLEHALAVLVGKAPADFSLPSMPLVDDIPLIPVEIPASLLERRPDIASAERQVASANAQVGVDTAAFFPNLTLSASYGYAASASSKLLQASNSLWSFGPALAETLLDFGARSARLDQAKAQYDQSVASYRQTVLTAFQQVEDQLSAQRILADQSKVAESAVASAREAEGLMLNRFNVGVIPYSSVLAAQNAALASEQSALTVRQNRFLASVSLIESLGGGWSRAGLPTE